ncbi:MAG: YihY/virulence factor BrkB family protein [Burkholderiaceae bacterium]
MPLRTVWSLARETLSSWSDDYASSMGAALAYYTMFSIAPLLLIVISVAGLAFGEQAARGEIMDQLASLMGADGARAVQALLASVNQPTTGIWATLFGLGALIVGATTVFGELQNALDRIWRAPDRPHGTGAWRWLRSRLLSLGMIFGIGFLLMVSLVASAMLAAVQRWFGRYVDLGPLAALIDFSVSFGFITVAFAMIYKLMPRVQVQWRDVWIGAVVTALLFTVGKMAIGLYIGRSAVASAFGAAASLVAVVVWVYWSAQIFLLGAEFTWVYARRFGSLHGRTDIAPAAR